MRKLTQSIISGIIAQQQTKQSTTDPKNITYRQQENPFVTIDKGKKVINVNYTNFQVFGDLIDYTQSGHIDRLYLVSPAFQSFKIWKDGELWYSGNPEYYENLGVLVHNTVNNKYYLTIIDIDFDSLAASIDNGIVLYTYNVQGYLTL